MQGLKASMTAQVAWTPLWAAPEVFRQERATVKADIWSYGIIIYELVGNPAPFAVSLTCAPALQPAVCIHASAHPV